MPHRNIVALFVATLIPLGSCDAPSGSGAGSLIPQSPYVCKWVASDWMTTDTPPVPVFYMLNPDHSVVTNWASGGSGTWHENVDHSLLIKLDLYTNSAQLLPNGKLAVTVMDFAGTVSTHDLSCVER